MLYTSKESLEHVEFIFRWKKYDLLQKEWKKIIFNFFSKGGPFDVGTIKKIFCDFSNFQKFS